MSRDYQDMTKIFDISRLPQSFKIEKVHYPYGRSFGPDGPPAVLYKVRVAGTDYDKLVSGLQEKKHAYENNYGMYSAVGKFDPELDEYALLSGFEEPPKPHPDQFTQITKAPGGYDRKSYIVADTRTSNPVNLYITTWLPFEG
jgi:hypothetical protein